MERRQKFLQFHRKLLLLVLIPKLYSVSDSLGRNVYGEREIKGMGKNWERAAAAAAAPKKTKCQVGRKKVISSCILLPFRGKWQQ